MKSVGHYSRMNSKHLIDKYRSTVEKGLQITVDVLELTIGRIDKEFNGGEFCNNCGHHNIENDECVRCGADYGIYDAN